MTNACDLRFDFLGWASRRLGASVAEIEEATMRDAATTAVAIYGDHPEQERRDGSESDERRPREKRLVCCA